MRRNQLGTCCEIIALACAHSGYPLQAEDKLARTA
jgi:hypothetical protein